MSIDKKRLEKELDKLKKGINKREEKSLIAYSILKEAFYEEYEELFKEDINLNLDEESLTKKIKDIPSDLAKIIIAKKLAVKYIDSNDYNKALDILKQVEKLNDNEIHKLIGICFYKLNNYNESKKYLEKVKNASDKETTIILAKVYSQLGKYKDSAELYIKTGEIDSAVKEFLKANEIDKALNLIDNISDETKYDLLNHLIKNRKIDIVKKFVEHIKDEKLSLLIKAKIEFNEKQSTSYTRELSEIIETSKDKKGILSIIIASYVNMKKYKEAIEVAKKYKDIVLADDFMKFNLAIALKETGNELDAVKILATLMNSDFKKRAKEIISEIEEKSSNEEVKDLCKVVLKEDNIVKRLKEKLLKSTNFFVEKLQSIFTEKTELDLSILDEIEELLISFDISYDIVSQIIKDLKRNLNSKNIKTKEELIEFIKSKIYHILKPREGKLNLNNRPSVILVVGVNGTGKTTTIAKLGYHLKNNGYRVLFCAGDTFRAAAIEQLENWGNRLQIPVVKQKQGADPSGVVYDSINIAISRGYDVIIIDTAGRLHTKENLMEELKKIKRTVEKLLNREPDEVLLVLDALTGQNAINQAKYFKEATNITGIILTKLDSTAKGGIIVSIADKFGIPIKFIGTGEKVEDLEIFDADKFVSAIFD